MFAWFLAPAALCMVSCPRGALFWSSPEGRLGLSFSRGFGGLLATRFCGVKREDETHCFGWGSSGFGVEKGEDAIFGGTTNTFQLLFRGVTDSAGLEASRFKEMAPIGAISDV